MTKRGVDLLEASNILRNGGVVAFPTETVMGLGVVFDDYNAYTRLNTIKGRPESKPYTMMLSNKEGISKYAYVNEIASKIIDKYMPGPITILLRAKDNVPTWVSHGSGVIGIRVPNHALLLSLLKMVDKPLLVPSANPSNMPPALTSEKVSVYFGETLDYIIENNSNGESPSTVVDLSEEEVKIIREGPVSKEGLIKAIKEY